MIDHILQFADETAARTALAPLGYVQRDPTNVWRWDTSRVIAGQNIVRTEAIWNNTDPNNPVLVTPEQRVAGYWVMISLRTVSPALRALAGSPLKQVRDRDKAARGEAYTSDDAGVVLAARLAPVFAGSKY